MFPFQHSWSYVIDSKFYWDNDHKWDYALTHWGRVTHICVGKITISGSDNGLSPGRRQAIIWTNAGILLIEPLGTNPSQIVIGIQTFSFKKMHLKVSSANWRPFCLGFYVLNQTTLPDPGPHHDSPVLVRWRQWWPNGRLHSGTVHSSCIIL